MFYKLYGKDISFARHGQPLLQAANIVDNGGNLLVKRVVANDSTLANIAVVAKLSKTQVQKTDAKGRPIYQTPLGNETTVADGNTPVMIDCCKIKYECKSVSGVKTIQAAAATINSMLNDAMTMVEHIHYLLLQTTVEVLVVRNLKFLHYMMIVNILTI